MDAIDYIKQQLEIHKEKLASTERDLAEMRQQVPSSLIKQFLRDYRPFVNKFFGDMTVKTIRWDDELQKFIQVEKYCDQAHYEFLNTVDRFYHSERYWNLDPIQQRPNIRVWVERQDTIARLEGY
jgi:hypothetical protein